VRNLVSSFWLGMLGLGRGLRGEAIIHMTGGARGEVGTG
jgi:hypothetical protein